MTGTMLRDENHLRDLLGIPFSEEQMAAIVAPSDRPGVIVAGAGSGKTTVMAARVVWLVGHEGVDPGSVLGLTFTNKAASELGARVRQALQRLVDQTGRSGSLEEWGLPAVSTYHAYAGSLIAEYGLLLGFEPDVRVTSDASRFQRAARAVTSYRGQLAHVSTSMPHLLADVLGLDGQMADHLVSPAQVRAFDEELRRELAAVAAVSKPLKLFSDACTVADKRDELLTLVERYRAVKAESGVMDFSDQMERGGRLAIECPEVSAAQRERYAVVLLDEYQDTSVAQRDMLQGIFSGASPADGRGHCVTAVGDPCQGIYGWRGAASNNLTGFLDDFLAPDGSAGGAYSLQVNRRSGARILDVANTLAQPYYATSTHVRPLVAPDGALPGEVRAALHTTVAEEIAWLAEEVDAAHDDLKVPWSEIAILARNRTEIPMVTTALRDRSIPVEVVGLTGLLAQPEVEDVLAVLAVLDDMTANASMLRLLTGPWLRIGPRDLALLGRRARALIDPVTEPGTKNLRAELDRSVRGVDPTEVLSLAEAVEDPGGLDYSASARERFAELGELLTRLRRHIGESPVELVRRVVTALGLDVELAALPGSAAELALDNLALLVDAVAEFVGNDPTASLSAVLAYLGAEDDYNNGMDVASPGSSDSVKLLTVHTAKGLEWDAVFVPFMSGKVFPSDRGRPGWVTTASALPGALRGDAATQPTIEEWSTKGLKAFKEWGRADALMEERRLGYVSLTRARRLLVTSGHHWGRTQKNPRGPSDFLEVVRGWIVDHGGAAVWADAPDPEADNPMRAEGEVVSWPATWQSETVARRRAVAAQVTSMIGTPPAHDEPPDGTDTSDSDEATRGDLERLAGLDTEIELLLSEVREQRSDEVVVAMPSTMSATSLMAMRDDPEQFAHSLVRPMPRRPSAAARLGTRLHAWIESRFDQQMLFGEDELPGRDTTDIDDEQDLAELIEAFAAGPYGQRRPHAVEVPFSLRLAGRNVRGRIDAVYRNDETWELVDWKTSRRQDADPFQLAVYRLAWAEMHDLNLADVDAAFSYVRLGVVDRPAGLPDRDGLERLVREAADRP